MSIVGSIRNGLKNASKVFHAGSDKKVAVVGNDVDGMGVLKKAIDDNEGIQEDMQEIRDRHLQTEFEKYNIPELAKKAKRPGISTTRKDADGNPVMSRQYRAYKKSGALINDSRQRVDEMCRILGCSKKRYRKFVKEARRNGSSELEFQEHVFRAVMKKHGIEPPAPVDTPPQPNEVAEGEEQPKEVAREEVAESV